MATIRITCPTCGKILEIGAEHDGQEVECGECLQVFVARGSGGGKIRGAPSGKTPAGKPGSPGRKRDDEDDEHEHDRRRGEFDDDDYLPPRRGQRAGGGGMSGAAVIGLIAGIFALLTSCCPATGILLGILAMVLGALGKRQPESAGTGTAAVVLGSIAFLISAGVLVWAFAAGGWVQMKN
jgi:hypothetical protein